ncbi:unannotated protein [freshwater metagenome]|uniref:Unannotated protein n=1 Tax=freshwater metagenome TaxID=449393 RepID=A0A6J6F897_9ZZZZ|nr:hypothetical protein [Actinomycetota bacterium]
MGINRYQVIFISAPLLITPTYASASCINKTCVDVFTADNQLVITAQKGSQKPPTKVSSKPAPKPIVKKPVAKPAPKPAPIVKKPVSKPIAKSVTKPSTKPVTSPSKRPVIKQVAKPKKVATASLSDRLIKLLPVGDINYQPTSEPLVNLPVYFWTQTPTRFTALVPILDVVVYVNLTPTFTWSYGDGAMDISKLPGAAYPIGTITHTYKSAGNYQVNLKITWNGTWMVNGVTTPITGNAITQSISTTLSVVKAPTRFIE